MNKKLPPISHGKKICIICEGYEEYEYMDKLVKLNVWNKKYKFFLINAEGNGNIPARYHEKYVSDSYDIVLVFCDTDKKPYEDYETIKYKINTNTHGIETASEQVIMYANPCTMQVILLHFDNIKLDSHKKHENGHVIKTLTGVSGYEAKQEQRDQLFEKINAENYNLMKDRVEKLPNDDTIKPSSNFSTFLNNFTSSNDEWIDQINAVLEN